MPTLAVPEEARIVDKFLAPVEKGPILLVRILIVISRQD